MEVNRLCLTPKQEKEAEERALRDFETLVPWVLPKIINKATPTPSSKSGGE